MLIQFPATKLTIPLNLIHKLSERNSLPDN